MNTLQWLGLSGVLVLGFVLGCTVLVVYGMTLLLEVLGFKNVRWFGKGRRK